MNLFQSITCGPYQTNVYYAIDPHSALIIDAAPESFDALKNLLIGKKVQVLLTHGHWDHVADASKFQQESHATLYGHPADSNWFNGIHQPSVMPPWVQYTPFTPDHWLQDNQTIETFVGAFQVVHLPGHTAGCVGFYLPANNVLFSGDTLFCNAVGRTDLTDGSFDALTTSIDKLLQLPPTTQVFPGHGRSTTLQEAKIFWENEHR
ncbi:MAG: MBL fold metallo-hydrolase [Opitutales bacterium]|nr:MBL fold metallo-hydrolase [Opitutales bacterium]